MGVARDVLALGIYDVVIREGVEEIFGAICEPCHLWVKDYRMLPETALEELYALHLVDTGQRVSKRHRPEFLCKPEWESIRVKVTPPVGEWRTKPYKPEPPWELPEV